MLLPSSRTICLGESPLVQDADGSFLVQDFFACHASSWNGTSLIIHPDSQTILLASDASGSWVCGGWQGIEWFQIKWDDNSQHLHIAAKEIVPRAESGGDAE